MNEKPKEKWLAFLATAKQTTGCLHNLTDNSYCCLGALTQCYLDETGKTWDEVAPAYSDGQCGWQEVLPEEVADWAGLEDNDPDLDIEDDGVYCMTHFNDERGYTFQQLAELIKKQL